jgi:hypothetical protein
MGRHYWDWPTREPAPPRHWTQTYATGHFAIRHISPLKHFNVPFQKHWNEGYVWNEILHFEQHGSVVLINQRRFITTQTQLSNSVCSFVYFPTTSVRRSIRSSSRRGHKYINIKLCYLIAMILCTSVTIFI